MGAYKGNDKYIFISYSHKNKDLALPFIEELQKHYNVWYDEGLTFGLTYDDEITDRIVNCSLFIFLVTKDSIASEYCLNEIRFATDMKHKPFINVYLEPTIIPDSFEFKYGRYQYCNCYSYDSCGDAIRDMESKSDSLKSIKVDSLEKEPAQVRHDVVKPKKGISDSNNEEAAIQASKRINDLFDRFCIDARVSDYSIGATFTRLDIEYGNSSSGTVSRMIPDIEIALGGIQVSFVPVVPGKTTSGLYFANKEKTNVDLFDAIEEMNSKTKNILAIPLGRDANDKLFYASFEHMNNVIIGGTSGSGKSTFLRSAITSIASRVSPGDVKFVFMDFSKNKFDCFSNIPHLIMRSFNDHNQVASILKKLSEIIDDHFKLFYDAGVNDIDSYNTWINQPGVKEYHIRKMMKVVIVINGYDDFVSKNKYIAPLVNEIAKKSKESGFYFLLSMRRPNSEVINELPKAYFPTRIAFLTSDSRESKILIGEEGAERLLGQGDMLVSTPVFNTSYPIRLQGCYASLSEFESACKNIIKKKTLFTDLATTISKASNKKKQ